MRRGLSTKLSVLTGAAFCCAALVLLRLLAAPGLFSPSEPRAAAPAPTPPAETAAVVFFGSAQDPLCGPLYGALEEACSKEGWRLVSYDCKGNAAAQAGQVEDFLRTGTADGAVLFSLCERKELDGQVKALAAQCPVVTVGKEPGTGAARLTAAHIGEESGARSRALAEYLRRQLGRGQGALLLTDVPDEDAERQYRKAFAAEKVDILDSNYTWGGAVYARRYLDTALEEVEHVGAVVCTSREGTAGTWRALQEKELRGEVKIASLFYEPAMADDLALGELDAAVTVSSEEAAELLTAVLPRVLRGETPGEQTLTPVVLTPETIDGETE